MALPANYQVVAVHGKYVDFLGAPMTGKVVFTPKTVLQDPASDTLVVPSGPITAPLTGGEFTANLPSTDDPDLSPVGWTYSVQEQFSGGRTFDLEVPWQTVGQLEMADLSPAVPATGVTTYIVKQNIGAPNGVAGLDANGHIPLAQLGSGSPNPLTYLDGSGGWSIPAGTGGGGGGGSGTVTQVNGVNPDVAGHVALVQTDIPGTVGTSAIGSTVASLSGGKVPIGQLPVGSASGVAGLDSAAKVPTSQLPDLSSTYITVGQKGIASGVATLDSGGKILSSVVPDLSATYLAVGAKGAASGVGSLNASGVQLQTEIPRSTVGSIQYTGGAYPQRTTVTTDTTRLVIWKGPTAPAAGGNFAVDGVDAWLKEG